MCGLVGMIGNIVDQDKKAFRNLLRFDVVRGEDSTGVAVVGKVDDEIKLYKKVGAPDHLFSSFEDWDDKGMYKGASAKAFIGHNRAATKGSVTDSNAHPFWHGSVVGAHNGTLVSTWPLEDGNKFDVDSEAIFYNLSKYQVKDVIKDVWGAYALTWYDQDEDKLFVIRNDERPLHWTRRKDKDVIYWASMPWMLELALAYARVSHGEIHEFEKDVLYSFDLNQVSSHKTRDTDWETEKGVEGYEPPRKVWTAPTHTPLKVVGGTSNNAGPFPASSSRSSSSSQGDLDHTKAEITLMKSMVDKTMEFRFEGVKKGISNMEYLAAYPDNPLWGFKIRVFSKGHTDHNEWASNLHRQTYKGRVKRLVTTHVRGKKEVYLLIDLRSIEKTFTKKPPVPVMSDSEVKARAAEIVSAAYGDSDGDYNWYEGYNGRYLTKEEWDAATKDGCACCLKEADANDADATFIGHESFLCGECSALEINSAYVQNFKS